MHRLFLALRPPATIRAQLMTLMAGIPGARWQDDGQLHLTVRYIGEVDRRSAEEIALACDRLGGESAEVTLAGVGAFKRRGSVDTLWAGIGPVEPLARLHRKADQALVRLGLAPERRAYQPHVTLARFSRIAGDAPEIRRWLTDHAALASAPFRLAELVLYESHLGGAGAHYAPVARYPLRRPP